MSSVVIDNTTGKNEQKNNETTSTLVELNLKHVFGVDHAIEALKPYILQCRFPSLLKGKRSMENHGILLYGPQGTGKSYLAKAVAKEAKAKLIIPSGQDLLKTGEEMLKKLFDQARRSIIEEVVDGNNDDRIQSSILLFHHIDSWPENVIECFNAELKTISIQPIFVIGTTNMPWKLNNRLTNRFSLRLYINLPDKDARVEIFKMQLNKVKHQLNEHSDFDVLALLSNGYSGKDINNVVKEALMEPIRECQKARFFKITNEHQMLVPVIKYPPCSQCPMKFEKDKKKLLCRMSWSSFDFINQQHPLKCDKCGSIRIQVTDPGFPSNKLQIGDLSFYHLKKILESRSMHNNKMKKGDLNGGVDQEVLLKRFDKWTKEFG